MKPAMFGVVFAALVVATFGLAQCAAAQTTKPAPQSQSKTARCMEIEDFKLAMACLNGLVVEHNREKMRKAINSH